VKQSGPANRQRGSMFRNADVGYMYVIIHFREMSKWWIRQRIHHKYDERVLSGMMRYAHSVSFVAIKWADELMSRCTATDFARPRIMISVTISFGMWLSRASPYTVNTFVFHPCVLTIQYVLRGAAVRFVSSTELFLAVISVCWSTCHWMTSRRQSREICGNLDPRLLHAEMPSMNFKSPRRWSGKGSGPLSRLP